MLIQVFICVEYTQIEICNRVEIIFLYQHCNSVQSANYLQYTICLDFSHVMKFACSVNISIIFFITQIFVASVTLFILCYNYMLLIDCCLILVQQFILLHIFVILLQFINLFIYSICFLNFFYRLVHQFYIFMYLFICLFEYPFMYIYICIYICICLFL